MSESSTTEIAAHTEIAARRGHLPIARAVIGTIIGAAIGFGLVVGLRLISGLEPFQTE